MTETFRWLHLTDLHWGCTGHEHRWNSRKGTFKQSLGALFHETKLGLPLDAVFFTGDLVNMGKASEFQELNHFLNDLWAFFKENQEAPPFLIPIPGNHDLVRPDEATHMEAVANLVGLFSLVQDTGTKRKLRKAVFQRAESSNGWNLIKDAFANYEAWWEALPADIPKANLKLGAIPGDFSWSLNKGGKRLGIVGLNSAFLQLDGENYEGMLALCLDQLQSACGDIEAWERSHALRMVLSHHPVSWLSSEWQRDFETETCPAGRFHLHLSGHTHTSVLKSESKNGSKIRHNISSFSLFGAEKIKGKKGGSDIDRVYGYGAGKIELGNETGKMYLWAKECKLIPGTGYHFVNPEGFGADPETDGAGPYYLEYPKNALVIPPTGTPIQEEVKAHRPIQNKGNLKDFVKGNLKALLEQDYFGEKFQIILRSRLGIDLPAEEALVDHFDAATALLRFSAAMSIFLSGSRGSGQSPPKKMLMDLEIMVGWLAILGLKEEWQPEATKEIDFIIPVARELGLGLVVARMTRSSAKYSYYPEEGVLESPAQKKVNWSLAQPLPDDWEDQIKRDLWLSIPGAKRSDVFKMENNKETPIPFDTKKNDDLEALIKLHTEFENSATPYLLLNPNRESFQNIPVAVLQRLRNSLPSLKLVCITSAENIWQDGIKEADMIERIKHCYAMIHGSNT